ncbi:MAG: VanW family protein, partial [Patescibacteria group bacterium]
TERHNHSLVVQYYADPVNGNPGTDATLYEPTLDLKFLNDTGHYLLLLTNIDYKKQMLTFSLWGTKDGRIGWYSHPLVSKWIPAPTAVEYVPVASKTAETKNSEVAKCQSAFRGAMASFTYSRVTPTGEHIDRVFNSYYRPLPKICPATTTPVM